MRILITGGTGLIGRRLLADRLSRGDEVVLVTRDRQRARRRIGTDATKGVSIVEGDPATAGGWQKSIDGCDAVINLAGAGVADRRWTTGYKKLLVDSRVNSAARVVDAITESQRPPGALIGASATGYYGARGDECLDESAGPGDDFLARLAVAWEHKTQEAASAGARVVNLRFGVVLDRAGGALPKMIPPFRFFCGGPLGSGRQYMPWVHWGDVIGLIDLALHTSALTGPLNVVAPEAVTSRTFARTFGRVLKRPAVLPVPRLALRLVLGELADYATMSQRVEPAAAHRHGYRFRFPRLQPALESLLEG